MSRNHRDTYHSTRNRLTELGTNVALGHRDLLDNAYREHIRALNAFTVVNSDDTMVNLVGTWARITKIIRDSEDYNL